MNFLRFIAVFILFFSYVYCAQANLALTKQRLFFDNNNRTDSLQIRNVSSEPVDYDVTLSLTSMTEEGTVFKVDEDPLSAVSMLRYSPKRGSMGPGERQVVRFSLRKPAALADGEYRAVLSITTTMRTVQQLSTRLSYGVPIIVRHGRVTASTELLAPKLVMISGTPHVEFWQTRKGNRSLYGSFIVTDEQGKEIGIYNNSALYLPLPRRKISIALNKKALGKIRVDYQEILSFGGDLNAQVVLELK